MNTPDTSAKPCCSPATNRSLQADQEPQAIPLSATTKQWNRVTIPAGKALVGTKTALIKDDGEAPARTVAVKAFQMACTTVTNATFAEFVAETGYVTEAERFGWSFVFWKQVPDSFGSTKGVRDLEWWRRVDGANWRDINGPGTAAQANHPDHPVVHISWHDAQAFATWAGGRLPTEAEWEHAARGGLGDVPFPWGTTEPDDTTTLPCNIWQGQFPHDNTGADGHVTTAPAQSYAPNGYGLYNMVGNVWEWTADAYKVRSLKKKIKDRLTHMKGYKLFKGGSYLCHRSYCYRYRIAARSAASADSSTTHQGFRVVWPIED